MFHVFAQRLLVAAFGLIGASGNLGPLLDFDAMRGSNCDSFVGFGGHPYPGLFEVKCVQSQPFFTISALHNPSFNALHRGLLDVGRDLNVV